MFSLKNRYAGNPHLATDPPPFPTRRKEAFICWRCGSPEGHRAAGAHPGSVLLIFPPTGLCVGTAQAEALLILASQFKCAHENTFKTNCTASFTSVAAVNNNGSIASHPRYQGTILESAPALLKSPASTLCYANTSANTNGNGNGNQ